MNLFDEKTTNKIKEYIKCEDELAYFLEQASRIKKFLENGGEGTFSTIRAMLGEEVEDDDFELIIKQISFLKLLNVKKEYISLEP